MKRYLAIFEQTDTGYGAYVPDLPGCVATGATKEETEQLLYEAIQFHIEGLQLDGLPLPATRSEAEVLVFA